MKRKQYILSVTVILMLGLGFWVSSRWHAWFHYYLENPFTTPSGIDRVVMTYGEKPNTQRVISWRSGESERRGRVHLYRLAMGDSLLSIYQQRAVTSTFFQRDALLNQLMMDSLWISGKGTLIETDGGKSIYYRAELNQLAAGSYAYQISTGIDKSPFYFFKVKKAGYPYKFAYIGDIQQRDTARFEPLFLSFYQAHSVDAWAYIGDVIERPMNKYWDTWFASMQGIPAQMPLLVVPGNHEYQKNLTRDIDKRWTSIFSYPKNGTKQSMGHTYFYEFDSTLFVMLDTEDLQMPWQFMQARSWLKKVLKQSSAQYKIVMMHHPVQSVRSSRLNLGVKLFLGPVLQNNGVTLLLQGHDHGYGRHFTQRNGQRCLPLSVVSACSEKNYLVGFKNNEERMACNQRLIQIITLGKDSVDYKSYMETGVLYDDLSFTFDSLGKLSIDDRAINWDEKIEMPERYLRKGKEFQEKFEKQVQERQEKRKLQ